MSSPPALDASMAVFLDFDGTLAPIQNDPDSVALPEAGAARLLKLSDYLDGALAVISGRALSDLSIRVPRGVWRLGGHGLDAAAPGAVPRKEAASAPETLTQKIQDLIATAPNCWMEQKGPVLAVHYRANPDAGSMLSEGLQTILLDYPDYRLQSGKMVFEAKPISADKGLALSRLLGMAPFAGRKPVMIGDDTTDEAAMQVAISAGGYGIKVGDGPSVATHRLQDPEEVWAWLNLPPK